MQHQEQLIITFWIGLWLALSGSIVYNFVLFVIAKNECDNCVPTKPFPYLDYGKKNWDNWALATIIVPWVVFFMPSLTSLANDKLEGLIGFKVPPPLFYLGAGPLSELIIIGVMLLSKYKAKFIPPVHIDTPKQNTTTQN